MADRRQIDQMCRFILQEAQEKAQEIMIKTDHDCMRNKQLEVLKANKVTDAKFEERLLQLDADKKVLRSQAVARARRQKGECAHILVDQVEALALSKMKEQVQRQPEAYRTLLGKMITEALVQLDEEFVSIECVKGEEAIVESLLPASLQEYKKTVHEMYKESPIKYQSQYDVSLKCTAAVDQKRPLPDGIIGGVKCVGAGGRITCDNTLNARLRQTREMTLPRIRKTLFPSMSS